MSQLCSGGAAKAAFHLEEGRKAHLRGNLAEAEGLKNRAEIILKSHNLSEAEAMVGDLLLTVWENSLAANVSELPEWQNVQATLRGAETFLQGVREAHDLEQGFCALGDKEPSPEEIWAMVHDKVLGWDEIPNPNPEQYRESWETFRELGFTYGFL